MKKAFSNISGEAPKAKKTLLPLVLVLVLVLGLCIPITAAADGFADVPASAYYAAPVKWAVENNITVGTSATTFSPDEECTTAQILTFLWRAAGKPSPKGANPFTDVKEGDFYYSAALWAHDNGMVSGKTFSPSSPCTRSQTVSYLWKYAGKPSAPAKRFDDVSAGADYAAAVSWAVDKGVTNGTSATTFSPDATCTRGQIVTFLHRDIGGAPADTGSAAVPEKSDTQLMAQAMLDKISELGSTEAYLLDMNADGTPELIYKDSNGDYHVLRWGNNGLYEYNFDRPDYWYCYGIAKYHDEYAFFSMGGAGAAAVYYFCFLDRIDELCAGAIFIGYDEEGIPDYDAAYSYNGKDISYEQYSQLYDEYGIDNINAVMDSLPSAKAELNKLLAG